MKTIENFICPHCGKKIESSLINSWKAGQVGSIKSEKKAASSAENGKKGGRPPLEVDNYNAYEDEASMKEAHLRMENTFEYAVRFLIKRCGYKRDAAKKEMLDFEEKNNIPEIWEKGKKKK